MARLSVEVPLSVSLHHWDGERPFLTAHHQNGAIGILGVNLDRLLLVTLDGEGNGSFLVRHRIGTGHKILSAGAEHLQK